MMKDSAIPNMSPSSLSASHHVEPSHAASGMCTEEGCDALDSRFISHPKSCATRMVSHST